MIGSLLHARIPRITSTPSMPGSPRSMIATSGLRSAAIESALSPSARGQHVVAARAEVGPEPAQDLRLVVDHQHARHGATSNPMTMVSPPPGVSSIRRSPPMASTNPRATARPSPTPSADVRSPSRWNGSKTRSRSSMGMPGPRSTTRSSTRSSVADPATWTGCLGPVPRARVGDEVRDRPLEQRRIHVDPWQGFRHVHLDGTSAVRAGSPAPWARPRRGRPWSARGSGPRSGSGSCRGGCPPGCRAGPPPPRSRRGTRWSPPRSSARRPGADC